MAHSLRRSGGDGGGDDARPAPDGGGGAPARRRGSRSTSEPLTSWIYRSPVRNWPFIRGIFVLWDALMLGMRALDSLGQCRFH